MLATLDTDAIVPSDDDQQALEAIRDFVRHTSQYTFEHHPSKDPTGELRGLPEPLLQVLVQAARELARGNAVAIVPLSKELTTQEAADILNVSRPYLIKLLEQGDIPFVKTGTHRRVRLSDLLAYKRIRDAERRRGLARLTQMSQEMGLYDE
jgi:excisionase family DNA binding protein